MSDFFSCYCTATQRQVQIEGRIVGHRQADLLKITDCEHKHCPKRHAVRCLIGKIKESRWQ